MSDHELTPRSVRRAVAGALAAELGHELQGPLNLFRMAAERVARGERLDAEDAEALHEVLEDLSRMSSRLRELAKVPALDKGWHAAHELVALALALPLDRAHGRGLELEMELGSSAAVRVACDRLVLAQALRELLVNAVEAKTKRAGVLFVPTSAPRSGFCVWDDGAGFSSADEALRWGASSHADAAGLGLSLALRAARAHGFNLELRREAERTEAWLLIPPEHFRHAADGRDP